MNPYFKDVHICVFSWWRHQMETFSALLTLCVGNSPVTGEFPAQRPVTRSFDVFFDLRLNKRLSKQSWCWWFETPSRSLWRHYNGLKWNKRSVQAYHWWVGSFDGVYLPLLFRQGQTLYNLYIYLLSLFDFSSKMYIYSLDIFLVCFSNDYAFEHRSCDDLAKYLSDMYCVNLRLRISNNAHSLL